MSVAGVRVVLPDPPNGYDRQYMDSLVSDLERLLGAIASSTSISSSSLALTTSALGTAALSDVVTAWRSGGGIPGHHSLEEILASASRHGAGGVHNPYLRRAWSKAAAILRGETAARLNFALFGDSVAGPMREVLDARMKLELGHGGFAGAFEGDNGFHDDANGTNITLVTNDFVHSPIGVYHSLAAGGSKYWRAGNESETLSPMQPRFPMVFRAPSNCTRVGVYYVRRSGGGTFKVQISTKAAPTTYVDVTGLTAINTDGALGVQYLEATIAATDVFRIRVEHVSGGNAFVLGGLVGADVGVYTHGWTRGGLPMTSMVSSARFAELAALIPADVVMSMYLDAPTDITATNGFTLPQLIDGIMNPMRAAFPATQVPASVTPWAGKTALNARKPDFVWFGANRVENPGSVDQAAYNVAIRANALANNECFVDTGAIWGVWRDAWDVGVMGEGDGSGSSTHPRPWYYGALVGTFLNETRLIGGAFIRPLMDQQIERMSIGPTPAGTVNAANRLRVGSATNFFSAGPADVSGLGGAIAMIQGGGGVYDCSLTLRNTDANGRTHMVISTPGAFIIRDIGFGANFISYNDQRVLSLASHPSDILTLGPKGQTLTGVRHGAVTLTAGQATVTHASLTASARVVVTRTARGGTPGVCYEVAPAAGSFVITARTSTDTVETGDTSTISYVVVEP